MKTTSKVSTKHWSNPTTTVGPGPNNGPYLKELRLAITDQQKAYLESAAGNDTVASYVRDKLFYASPGDVPTIGAIGSIYQAAGKVIEAADQIRIQTAKTGRTLDSIAAIVKHTNEARESLPLQVVFALRPISEQADRLLALGDELHRLAQQLAAENLLGVLSQNPSNDIRPRARPDR